MARCGARWLSLLLVFATTATAQIPPNAEIRRLAADVVAQGRSPGIVVGIIDSRGRWTVISAGTSGRSDLPLDGNAVFEIGSLTKVFTATVLADMVLRGEVTLEQPLSSLVPFGVRVPSRSGRQITLRDLATHRSGLPRNAGNLNPANTRNPFRDYNTDKLFEFLSNCELTTDPGSEAQYSNFAVQVLGEALAKRAGVPYAKLIRQRILDRLQMRDTSIDLPPRVAARFVQGHDEFGEPTSPWDIPVAGAGGLRSTMHDLLKFAAANLSRSRRPLVRAMRYAHAPQAGYLDSSDIGLNWIVSKRNGRTLTKHNGATGGFASFMGFDPERNQAVIVLTNSYGSVNDIGMHLLDQTFPLDLPPARVPLAQAYRAGGVSAVLARARSLREKESAAWLFNEEQLHAIANWIAVSTKSLDGLLPVLQLNAELFPERSTPFNGLGDFYALNGKKDAAIAAYRKALSIDPNSKWAAAGLAKLHASRGDP